MIHQLHHVSFPSRLVIRVLRELWLAEVCYALKRCVEFVEVDVLEATVEVSEILEELNFTGIFQSHLGWDAYAFTIALLDPTLQIWMGWNFEEHNYTNTFVSNHLVNSSLEWFVDMTLATGHLMDKGVVSTRSLKSVSRTSMSGTR